MAAEGLGGFGEGAVVEQRQGLQRSVGNFAAADARFAAGGVEGCEHRERCGALRERVEAAAMTIESFADLPRELSVGSLSCDVGGLRRKDARSAELAAEQAADAQQRITYGLGFDSKARAASEQFVSGVSLQ